MKGIPNNTEQSCFFGVGNAVADYIFIVRHGETKANRKNIDAGPLDYPLTKKGIREVSYISKTISKIKFTAVYSSPVHRAVETAEILACPYKLRVKTLEELTEAELKPEFVGKKGRHHILTAPEAFCETNSELMQRTARAVEIMKGESEGNVIAVSHGDVVTAPLLKEWWKKSRRTKILRVPF